MNLQFAQIGLLLVKELRCLFRAKHIIISAFGFALLLVVVSSFSLRQIGFGQQELLGITPGVLWITFLFCAVLAMNFTFSIEEENGALAGMLVSGVDAGNIFLAKFLSNLLLLSAVQSCVLIVHSLLFGVDLFPHFFQLLSLSLLFAVGFVALGTLLSGIAVCSRAKEVLLPLMLFPLCLPEVAASVHIARELLLTGTWDTASFWLQLLAGFDVISVVLSWALFEHVVKG